MSLLLRRRELLSNKNNRFYIYNLGNQYTRLTNGWAKTLVSRNNDGSSSIQSNYLQMGLYPATSSDYPWRTTFVTQKAVSTIGFNKICVSWDVYRDSSEGHSDPSGDISFGIGLYTTSTGYDNSYITSVWQYPTNGQSKHTIELDLSSYQGSYFIGLILHTPAKFLDRQHYSRIYKVWLE